MKKYFLVVIFILMQACAAVNVRTDDAPEDQNPPSFQQTYNYWWWGLKGEYRINVREVCAGRPVEQMQTIDTLNNNLLQIVTLGIYWPRTARVWCGDLDQ